MVLCLMKKLNIKPGPWLQKMCPLTQNGNKMYMNIYTYIVFFAAMLCKTAIFKKFLGKIQHTFNCSQM